MHLSCTDLLFTCQIDNMKIKNEKWRLIALKLSGEANAEELYRLAEITAQDQEFSVISKIITRFWNSPIEYTKKEKDLSLRELNRISCLNKTKGINKPPTKRSKKK